MREITYKRDDGMIVKSIAYLSYRRGPIGEWMVGETPLAEIERTSTMLTTTPNQFIHHSSREWMASELDASVTLLPT